VSCCCYCTIYCLLMATRQLHPVHIYLQKGCQSWGTRRFLN
jgi:hypothetical protein